LGACKKSQLTHNIIIIKNNSKLSKRGKAICEIIALNVISIASFSGLKFIFEKLDRGQLQNYVTLILELVVISIPPADTPGAKEAKIQDFMIYFMESCSSYKKHNHFFNGLNELQATCLFDYSTNFE
jgi:predicted AAA+ superfamily ATPase